MMTWGDRKNELLRNLEYYRKQGDLRVITFGANQCTSYSEAYAYCVQWSFKRKLSSFCDLIRGSRPVASPYFVTQEGFALSPFEKGLYLDFLFLSLDAADRASKGFETTRIFEGDQLLAGLREAKEKHLPLSDQVALSKISCQRHGTQWVADVYKADLPYLRFFYGDKDRRFPWQRHKQIKDERKYSFKNIGQAFPASLADDEYTELLAWFWREKIFAINLATELSRYSPRNASPLHARDVLSALWARITESDLDFLKELIEVPFPAYRVSYVQAMFRWWVSDDQYSDVDAFLRTGRLSELMSNAICLPASNQRKVKCLPQEATIDNAVALVNRAVDLAICSFAEIYMTICLRPEGGIGTVLEDGQFWKTYQNVLCQLINEELQKWHRNQPGAFSYQEQMPLILLPAEDDHVKRLLSTLNGGDRISSADSVEYTKVQKLWCQQNGICSP